MPRNYAKKPHKISNRNNPSASSRSHSEGYVTITDALPTTSKRASSQSPSYISIAVASTRALDEETPVIEDAAGNLFDVNEDSDPDDEDTLLPVFELLEKNGFSFVRDIARGITGAVMLFAYIGDNEEIKKLLVNGKLLLKLRSDHVDPNPAALLQGKNAQQLKVEIHHAVMTHDNEWENIASMSKDTDIFSHGRVPLLAKVQLEEMKVIATQCVYFDIKSENIKNAEEYMRELGAYDLQLSRAGENSFIKKEITDSMRHFDNVFSSCLASLNVLHHRKRLLHLDFSARNVAIHNKGKTGVPIDFGSSLPMNAAGGTDSTLDFPRKPIYTYDHKTLARLGFLSLNKNNKASCDPGVEPAYSINTDLFSFKVFMLECLAYYCGVIDIYKNVHLLDLGKSIFEADDDTRISVLISNIKKIVDGFDKKDIRRNVVMGVLEKYNDFLRFDFSNMKPNETWSPFYQSFSGCHARTVKAPVLLDSNLNLFKGASSDNENIAPESTKTQKVEFPK